MANKVMGKVVMQLPVKLTEDELDARRQSLVEETENGFDLEQSALAEKERAKKAKESIEAAQLLNKAEALKLARVIRLGEEVRGVECQIEVNPPNVVTMRLDNLEIVEMRAATQEELQEAFDFAAGTSTRPS